LFFVLVLFFFLFFDDDDAFITRTLASRGGRLQTLTFLHPSLTPNNNDGARLSHRGLLRRPPQAITACLRRQTAPPAASAPP
jgi:hypothetical protein